jgi:hypothetical protein
LMPVLISSVRYFYRRIPFAHATDRYHAPLLRQDRDGIQKRKVPQLRIFISVVKEN